MDAQNPSALPTFASRTPVHIGTMALTVRDLGQMTGFYRDLLGLTVQSQDATGARLGVGDATILELIANEGAAPDDSREAGLYHTAFLMPTRADLARWVMSIAQKRVPVTGVSDHSVSEAIYLDGPEGNGIEVYSDRPPESWDRSSGSIKMTTEPLDLDDLVGAAVGAAPYTEAPTGLRVGHVHLRVGDTAAAAAFYNGVVGLDVIVRMRVGAVFLSSGGYHHHIGANVWHSRGAGLRDDNRAGLAWFSFEVTDATTAQAIRDRIEEAGAPLNNIADGFETRDPWGTRVRFVQV